MLIFLPYLSGTQSACAELYYHLRPVWLHRIFSYYPINGTSFGGGKNVTGHKMCVFEFIYNICLKCFSLQEDCSQILSQTSAGLHVKNSLFSSELNFLTRFSKNTLISNFMRIRPVRSELFLADGEVYTDTTNLIIAVHNFAKAPKKESQD